MKPRTTTILGFCLLGGCTSDPPHVGGSRATREDAKTEADAQPKPTTTVEPTRTPSAESIATPSGNVTKSGDPISADETAKPGEPPPLTLAWEAEGFRTPESVLYAPDHDTLFIANIDGASDAKDGKGFISKVALDGTVTTLEWVAGFDAPKGMAVDAGKLYVSDLTDLVAIDIASGAIEKRFPGEGAVFLNDVALAPDHSIYVSDSRDPKIYRFADGALKVWLEDPVFKKPNGVYVEGDTLLVGDPGKVMAVDLKTKAISTRIDAIGSIENTDGLVPNGDGAYFTSNWHGAIWLVSAPNLSKLLLDTTPDKINAADLEYVQAKKLLLVPTFFDNRVRAFTFAG